jgi:polyhydroxyalkanoate synthesis regulator phasin
MSTAPPPPDEPTEPLPPADAPRVRERLVDERVISAADPLPIVHFEDALRSLRTAVVLLGLLSVAALGVAVYALIKGQEADRASAGSNRVSRLNDRVDRLSSDLQRTRQSASGTADATDVNRLQTRLGDKADAADVGKLQRTVAKLQTQVTEFQSNNDTTAALDQVDQRLDDLSRQVRALQDNAQTSP